MGEHFDSVILPRLKKVIGGFKSGVAKEFNRGGVIKVYALESYEEILKALKEALIGKEKQIFTTLKAIIFVL